MNDTVTQKDVKTLSRGDIVTDTSLGDDFYIVVNLVGTSNQNRPEVWALKCDKDGNVDPETSVSTFNITSDKISYFENNNDAVTRWGIDRFARQKNYN